MVRKFQTEPDYISKENLQNTVERYQCHLKDRKHKQFLRDLSDFKDNKVYSFTQPKSVRRDIPTDLSSTETENSDLKRDTTGPIRPFYKSRRGRGRGYTKTTARLFSRPTKPIYPLQSDPHCTRAITSVNRGDPVSHTKEQNESQIINVSSKIFTPVEVDILNKGLSFVPTGNFQLFGWKKDIHRFAPKNQEENIFFTKG